MEYLQETPRKENINHLNVKFPSFNLHQKAGFVEVLDKDLTTDFVYIRSP